MPDLTTKALIQHYYEDMWNRWNFALAEELLDASIVFRGSLRTEVRGRASFVEYMRTVRSAFPDFHNHVEELIADGESVAARLSIRSTYNGRAGARSASFEVAQNVTAKPPHWPEA